MQRISSPAHRSRVLLVDDDPVLIEALSTMIGLRLPHVTVVPCRSSRTALELLGPGEYELIISDLRMPQVDGLALLAQVRALRPAIPFILMSGHMDGRGALEALRLGAYSVIDKPIDRTAFIAWVERALLSREVSGAISQERLEMGHLSHMTQPLDPPAQNLQRLLQPLDHLMSTENRYALPMVFDRVAADLDLEVYFNYSLGQQGDGLCLEWYRGVSGQTAKDCEPLALGEAVCGTVAVSGQPDIVEDVQHRTDRKTTLVRTLGIQRYACFPCYQGTSVLGTLSFGSRHQERFQEKDLDMLQKVVELVCTRPR